MKKRLFSLALAVVMLCTMLPNVSVIANATTQLSANPYPEVEYGYTTETPVGTIRYIAQNLNSEYFSWNYWPTYSFGGYTGGPEIECGTACISMALSYVGVNRTPKALLETTNGYTASMWGQQGDATSRSITISTSDISSAMDNYINGGGKYSPLCVYIVPFSATSSKHWVLLVGRLGDNTYLALNPWHTAGTNGTFTIQINGTTATYNGITNPITSVNQWYNPNATPSMIENTYPAYCTIEVTADTTYIKSLPCSEKTDASSSNVEVAVKGDRYQAIGLVENSVGNLWYKVAAKNGSTGYMYAGDTTFVVQLKDDLTLSGVTVPTELKRGSTFSINGTIATQYQTITKVGAWVNDSSGNFATGDTEDVDTTSYNLSASKVDNGVLFNVLAAGEYSYQIGASIKTYYASSATTVSSKSTTVDLHESTFSVVENTSCSHSYSSMVTTAATCATNGVRTYTCSKCGASYTETIAATGNHSYNSKVTKAPGCTTNGVRTYTCSTCAASYTESIAATGHSYGSWTVTTAAGCTTAGTQKKTCSSCGDVQTQAIAATGHSYQSTVIKATCADYEKIRYTCSKCSHSYDEYSGGEYSDWSETKPSGVAEALIEKKTQYCYRNKLIMCSSYPSESGWTLYDQSTTWGDYGAWSDWSDTPVSSSDSLMVEQRTVWGYYYFQCPSCGAHMHGWNITCPTWAGGCGNAYIPDWAYAHVWSTTAWDDAGLQDWHGTGKYYTYIDGELVFQWTDGGSKTQYRFCTREQETMYYYYQWNYWSDWSDTVYEASSSRQVETRTLYRYLDPQLGGCTWDDGVQTKAPTCTQLGEKTYTCTVCADTRIETIAAIDHCYQDGYCTQCDAKDPEYQFMTGTIQTGTASGKSGDSVTVPVMISSNPGFAKIAVDIKYDTTVMELVEITKGNVLREGGSGSFDFNPSEADQDVLSVTWTSSENHTGNGEMLYLRFRISANASAGDYPVVLSPQNGGIPVLTDKDGHEQSVTFSSGKVQVEKTVSENDMQIVVETVSGKAGEQVDVTIAVKNNPGIASMKLKVSYDPMLTLTKVTYNSEIGGQAQQPQKLTSPVTLNWINGVADSEGDWVYATLTFQISEDAEPGTSGSVTVSYEPDDVYDISETNIPFAIVNGEVQISKHTPGDTNGDGTVNNKDLTRLFQYLSDWDVAAEEAALDVNGDGRVNNKDLTRLFQYLSDWDVEIF